MTVPAWRMAALLLQLAVLGAALAAAALLLVSTEAGGGVGLGDTASWTRDPLPGSVPLLVLFFFLRFL